ncbi:hypothetical protein C1701_03850 [Actinoalloteichus sp. AHMU CJ021]|uniref:Uncharacterized protein n=1 Tax=Actinoalloteichus caeruleus DSM 43889 TaxID=1120930 RepID=A0ABT1JGI6_ACTCY|nr:hypothetical protein C1701_03850 [Actinoalloteichus sp. AHMU CJ021]MCP2331548.1 hypothetical protein [Actinoalloteichus caeruleus DSM 43889]
MDGAGVVRASHVERTSLSGPGFDVARELGARLGVTGSTARRTEVRGPTQGVAAWGRSVRTAATSVPRQRTTLRDDSST